MLVMFLLGGNQDSPQVMKPDEEDRLKMKIPKVSCNTGMHKKIVIIFFAHDLSKVSGITQMHSSEPVS